MLNPILLCFQHDSRKYLPWTQVIGVLEAPGSPSLDLLDLLDLLGTEVPRPQQDPHVLRLHPAAAGQPLRQLPQATQLPGDLLVPQGTRGEAQPNMGRFHGISPTNHADILMGFLI